MGQGQAGRAPRRARQYGTLPEDPDASRQWNAFLEHEKQRGEQMQSRPARRRQRHGPDGEASPLTCAQPPTMPPSCLCPRKAYHPSPTRRCSSRRHRSGLCPYTPTGSRGLPPQQVPEGFTASAYTDALRRWARRMIADNKNGNMRYDSHCLTHGEAQRT